MGGTAAGARAPCDRETESAQAGERLTGGPRISVRSRGSRAGMASDAWGHAVGASLWLMGRAGGE